jgi:sugar lactone lactonase YvrE
MDSRLSRLPLLALVLAVHLPLRADFTTAQAPDLLLNPRQRPAVTARAVAVDPVTRKVFVSDVFGHRVLRYGSAEALQSDAVPEAVLGQRDTFASDPATTPNTLRGPTGITVDGSGRLWVADTGNRRILRFDHASSLASGAAAAGVLGQDSFFSSTPGTAANRLDGPGALAVDNAGRLWVADTGNHRILRWNNAATRANGAAAEGVLGQTGFTTGDPGTTATTLNSPVALALEESGGTLVRLWAGDRGNRRVLAYNSPAAKPNGGAADKVLGQSSFTTATLSPASATTFPGIGALAMQGADLWLADIGAHRVVRFAAAGTKGNGGGADSVIGQANFTTTATGGAPEAVKASHGLAVSDTRLWIADQENQRVVRHENAAAEFGLVAPDGILAASSLGDTEIGSAHGLATDPATGKLFVSDAERHRVLRYANVAALAAGSQPEAVLGQPDFQTTTAGVTAAKLRSPAGIHVDVLGNLWVADFGNDRVLRFAAAATLANGADAAQVFGSGSFTVAGGGTGAAGMEPLAVITEWELVGGGRFTSISRLWVADYGNHRVLRFDDPVAAGNGSSAAGVLGQFNFTNTASGLTANTMNGPSALAVDTGGRLWVADSVNRRVLRHDSAATKANGAAANGVLMQTSFTSAGGSSQPVGLALTPQGRLFVAMNLTECVRWFDNAAATPNGNGYDGELGPVDPAVYPENPHWRELNNPSALCLDPASSRLWVSDTHVIKRFSPRLLSRITGFGLDAQQRFQLTILGSGGETYQIRSSTDLINWSTIERTDTVPGSGTTAMSWTAPAPVNGPRKFFRLQLP